MARQRLEEYQRAIRIRYNMPTVLPLVVPPAAIHSAPQSSAVPSTFLPTAVHPAPFRHAAVTPFAVPPTTVPPTAVASLVLPSATVSPAAFLHAPFIPSAVPPAAIPPPPAFLPAVTHSSGHLLRPGCPRAEAQTPVPTETVSRDMGPLRPSHSDLGSDSKAGSDSLTVLRHKVFLKFLQNRLGVTNSDLQTDVSHTGHPSSQPSPPVSMAACPSFPISSWLSSSAVVSAASGTDQAGSSGMSPIVSVSTVVGQSPAITMATGLGPVITTRRGASDGFPLVSTGGRPVSRGVEVEMDGPVLNELSRERLELWDSQSMISQPQQQPPRSKVQDQEQVEQKSV